jgi:hypothetical protein
MFVQALPCTAERDATAYWITALAYDEVYAVAAIEVRKPSISACRLVVELDNCLADDSNWLDAAPVWLAP